MDTKMKKKVAVSVNTAKNLVKKLQDIQKQVGPVKGDKLGGGIGPKGSIGSTSCINCKGAG